MKFIILGFITTGLYLLFMRKSLKRIALGFVSLLLIIMLIYIWTYAPIITGYAAKTMCSGVFISNRSPVDIEKNDLNSFPCFHIPKYVIDYSDSSVTATFLGFASKTAVFRKGLGATVINNISKSELRNQHFHLTQFPCLNQDSIAWPQGNKTAGLKLSIIDTSKIANAISWAFNKNEDSISPTRAIVILYNGQLVYERYAKGFTANTMQTGWSMAKSVTNAMIGILVNKNKLKILSNAPMKEWQQDQRKSITLANLMQMNSGLHWWGFEAAASDQTKMLFKKDDMAGYAFNQSREITPGKTFNYSDGSTNILQKIIKDNLGDSQYYRFPYEELFYKIGMLNTVIEPDACGTFIGSSYVFSTARDWARLGLLYYNDGVWNGQRLLPVGWVKFSTTQSGAINKHKGGRYGAGWWVNQPDINSGGKRLYSKAPSDCYYAQGYDGQYVWVIPSKHLVVVRLARDAFNQFNPDDFLSDLIKSLPD